MADDQNRLELIQGTVGLLVLRALTRGRQHGHGVSARVREPSGGRAVSNELEPS